MFIPYYHRMAHSKVSFILKYLLLYYHRMTQNKVSFIFTYLFLYYHRMAHNTVSFIFKYLNLYYQRMTRNKVSLFSVISNSSTTINTIYFFFKFLISIIFIFLPFSCNLYFYLQEKPHKCSLCSKSFPTPGDLKSHMYVHNGSWPFKCDICNRGFSKQTNLKNHLLLHSGDKPHECQLCGKRWVNCSIFFAIRQAITKFRWCLKFLGPLEIFFWFSSRNVGNHMCTQETKTQTPENTHANTKE